MNVKELRIGNLISHSSGKTLIVDEIHNVGAMASFLSEKGSVTAGVQFFEPIPITAEWLERLGFKEYHSTDVVRRFESTVFDDMVFHLSATNYVVVTHLFVRCEYVHQLQNICFVLKGEELTLKTESK